jgi:adenine-specific DNA-methyltransferase
VLADHGVVPGTFCDMFSGTSVVAQMARLDGHTVVANDWQAYSRVLQEAFLLSQGYPGFARLLAAEPAIALAPGDRPRAGLGLAEDPGLRPDTLPLRRVLAHLEDLPPEEGRFFHAYCEGGSAGRGYFSRANGARCEAIRGRIAAWQAAGLLDAAEHALLVASLLDTMDHVANTASVYGAYLKHLKASARGPLVLRLPRLAPADGRPHRACAEDAAALVRRLAADETLDVLYLDPPYNHRQYAANYHVLETIARWDLDAFEPRGKTGLRPEAHQRSDFCSRPRVRGAFEAVLGAARARHILVSYSQEGLLPEAELQALLREKAAGGTVDFRRVAYRRFRADVDHAARRYKGDAVQEFLFYVRVAGV